MGCLKEQLFIQKNTLDVYNCRKFYYLRTMNTMLASLGNVPVTSSVVESLFPHYAGRSQKVQRLEKAGELVRLKRGLFVVSPDTSGKPLSEGLIANHLYAPSYVSMSSALRYYGLIPEAVYTTQSVTVKASRDFLTPLGRFEYTRQSKEVFAVGVTTVQEDGYAFLIATPEKALCDLIANSSGVNLRYVKDTVNYLRDDIRMDMDMFRLMDTDILKEYVAVGKKKDSIRTILKLLRS